MTNEILKPTPIRSTHYSRGKCGFVSCFFILKSVSLINTRSFPSVAFILYHPSIYPKYVHLLRDNTQSDFPTFHLILSTITCFQRAPGVPPHPVRQCCRSPSGGTVDTTPPIPPLPSQCSDPARTARTVSHLLNWNSAISAWLLCFVCLEKVTPSGKKRHNHHISNPNVPKLLTH